VFLRILIVFAVLAGSPQPPAEVAEAWRILVTKPAPGLTFGARR